MTNGKSEEVERRAVLLRESLNILFFFAARRAMSNKFQGFF